MGGLLQPDLSDHLIDDPMSNTYRALRFVVRMAICIFPFSARKLVVLVRYSRAYLNVNLTCSRRASMGTYSTQNLRL